MDRHWLEERLTAFPLYDYAFVDTSELVFTDRVHYICAHECPMYNTTWACPPAVGSVDACRKQALSFREGLLIATVAEVGDIASIRETLSTRAPHEEITREILEIVRQRAARTLTLSTEACAHCARCSYPYAPCRHPERMFPCIESYGILVTDLAERHGIDFLTGTNLVTWFSLILYE